MAQVDFAALPCDAVPVDDQVLDARHPTLIGDGEMLAGARSVFAWAAKPRVNPPPRSVRETESSSYESLTGNAYGLGNDLLLHTFSCRQRRILTTTRQSYTLLSRQCQYREPYKARRRQLS